MTDDELYEREIIFPNEAETVRILRKGGAVCNNCKAKMYSKGEYYICPNCHEKVDSFEYNYEGPPLNWEQYYVPEPDRLEMPFCCEACGNRKYPDCRTTCAIVLTEEE